MPTDRRNRTPLVAGFLILSLAISGCANGLSTSGRERCDTSHVAPEVTQAQRFREAETERAAKLVQEIERLKADLETAEAALVEAESGLAGTHTRADAVSNRSTALSGNCRPVMNRSESSAAA